MWENTRFIESLEGRELMSVSVMSQGAMARDNDAPAAIVMAAAKKTATKKIAKPAPKFSASNLVGKWKGTYSPFNSTATYTCTLKVISHKGAAAVADFQFSGLNDGKKMRSTAIVGAWNTFQVMLQGKNSSGGITAAISHDGTQIQGKWSFHANGKWSNGMFTFVRK